MSRVTHAHERASPSRRSPPGRCSLTGCSSGGGRRRRRGQPRPTKPRRRTIYAFGDAADSKGPAPEVKGAKQGGTITVLQRDSFAHLDPAQIYVSDEARSPTLIHRG